MAGSDPTTREVSYGGFTVSTFKKVKVGEKVEQQLGISEFGQIEEALAFLDKMTEGYKTHGITIKPFALKGGNGNVVVKAIQAHNKMAEGKKAFVPRLDPKALLAKESSKKLGELIAALVKATFEKPKQQSVEAPAATDTGLQTLLGELQLAVNVSNPKAEETKPRRSKKEEVV